MLYPYPIQQVIKKASCFQHFFIDSQIPENFHISPVRLSSDILDDIDCFLKNEAYFTHREVKEYLDYLSDLNERFLFIQQNMSYDNPQASHTLAHDRFAAGCSGKYMLPLAAYAYFLVSQGIRGSLLECGVFKGASTCCLSWVCEYLDLSLIAADTFEGLPAEEGHYNEGSFYGSLEEVRSNLEAWGKPERVTLLKGLFKDTLLQLSENVMLIWIDVDLQASAFDVLRYAYPHLVKGGVIFSDGMIAGHDLANGKLHFTGGEAAGIKRYFDEEHGSYQAVYGGHRGLGLIVPECPSDAPLWFDGYRRDALLLPEVAVITRTKDRPLFLERAIQSVLQQCFENWQHVIVNDGGDPQPVEKLVNRHAKAYAGRIKVIHQPLSRGMQTASNKGIEVSVSRYVVIHDDDDSWHPRYLESCVDFLKRQGPDHPCQGVITRITQMFEEVQDAAILRCHTRPYMPVEEMSLTTMIKENAIAPIAFLFRRKVLDKLGTFNPAFTVLGDWDFNLRFLSSYEIGIVKRYLANYHWRLSIQDSTAGNTVTLGIAEHREQLRRMRNYYLQAEPIRQYPNIGLLLQTELDKHQQEITRLLQIATERIQALEEALAATHAQQIDTKTEVAWMHLYARLPHKYLIEFFKLFWRPIRHVLVHRRKGLKQALQHSDPNNSSFVLVTKIAGALQMQSAQINAPVCEDFSLNATLEHIDSYQIISLDVFNTALLRKVWYPQDLFVMLENVLIKEWGLPNRPYANLRVQAEEQIRQQLLTNHPEWEEVKFDEIYEVFQQLTGLDAITIEKIKEKEAELEQNLAYAHPEIRAFYDYCRKQGKKVIFISDMYLEVSFIRNMLKKCGYEQPEVYVSSEYRLTKERGSLFKKVAEHLKVHPSAFLHVGDNPDVDIQQARNAGLQTLYFNRQCLPDIYFPHDRYLMRPLLSKDRNRSYSSIYAGLSLHDLLRPILDEAKAQPIHWQFKMLHSIGYQIVGPLRLMYAYWVLQKTLEYNCRRVFFAARDGYHLQPIFDLLAQRLSPYSIETTYLISSRRVLNFPVIEHLGYEELSMLIEPHAHMNIQDFLRRIGLRWEKYIPHLRSLGLPIHDEPITSPTGGFLNHDYEQLLQRFFLDIEADVLNQAAYERRKLLCYFESIGLTQPNSLLVDLGWFASSIRSVHEVLSSHNHPSPRGLYFATLPAAHRAFDVGCRFESFYYSWDKFSPRQNIISFKNISAFEIFFSAPHPSFIGLEKANEQWQGITEAFLYTETEKNIQYWLNRGARKLVEDILQLNYLAATLISLEYLDAVLDRLFNHPTQDESEVLGSYRHTHSFGNTKSARPLVVKNKDFASEQVALWDAAARKIAN